MNKYLDKKLLVLGSNVGSIDIVQYAKEHGAYVIVADYLPVEKSSAKQYADENWEISTVDIDLLSSKIKEVGVHGVIAGISEVNLLSAMKLSEMNGLRFYCNSLQWNLIENKQLFRDQCIKFGVPTPKTYYTGCNIDEVDFSHLSYPLVIKPVDACSSMGVYICQSDLELRQVFSLSLKESSSNSVIIEEFFEGDEFSAHYTITNGKVTLSSVDNRFPVTVNQGVVTSIPVARIYPSSFLTEYIEAVNSQMIDLIKSMKLETAVLFIQGLYNKDTNSFAIFEAGLRGAGEAPNRFANYINGVDYQVNILDYILLGKVQDTSNIDDPYFKGKKCALVSFVTKGGIVGKISGYQEVLSKYNSIIDSECRYNVGDNTPNGNTLRQIMLRFAIVSDSTPHLKSVISAINNEVDVVNTNGDPLCLKFDENLI